MHHGPHPAPVPLADADRAVLVGWTRRRTTAQTPALRARIVLACADRPEASNSAIGHALGVPRPTVHQWRERFRARGLAA